MIRALTVLQNGGMPNASLIEMLLFMIMGGGVGVALLVSLSPILRVSACEEANWKSVVGASLVWTAFIVVATAFHLRNAGIDALYRQRELENSEAYSSILRPEQ